ncbi:MAG: hypothetical protein HKN12_04645, partial [Gemmatimonadetes bacterium]|nr:hypothetical protein [Gemmatimonadota bacterium]
MNDDRQEELGPLADEIRKLPRSIDPPRDLWPEIEEKLRAASADRDGAEARMIR